jgi:hypothetical protein
MERLAYAMSRYLTSLRKLRVRSCVIQRLGRISPVDVLLEEVTSPKLCNRVIAKLLLRETLKARLRGWMLKYGKIYI